jgi:dienelactone hydrolase
MPQEIVLFHSALGLRPAMLDWAAHLRDAGHCVHTPDIFDGETFASVEDGLRKRDALGIPEIVRRTRAAVADLPEGLVFIGWSLGAAGAEFMAATRPGAKAAILLHGVVPRATLGTPRWPAGVPVQIHHAKDDPWVAKTSLQELQTAVASSGSRFEVFS